MERIFILGIETSCDETALAIVSADENTPCGQVLSERVLSQNESHAPYGGVVPEIAARSHIHHLDRLLDEVLTEAQMKLPNMSAIAATAGPGLLSGVMVGLSYGKALSWGLDKPFLAINHLEGHALSVRLNEDIAFPFLLLLTSGGHCQLLAVEAAGIYHQWGTALDDAAGEAFDKTAKLLGLGYPGGVEIERMAAKGDKNALQLPRPLLGRAGCDFSFSGLKTAVAKAAKAMEPVTEKQIADIAASFQQAILDCLGDRLGNAMERFAAQYKQRRLVVAGGVAANMALRA
ncbi:MAG: tRNA (adenosine(37)-N6)-threonylcarbamoyltransferase complex transferase subunit TsaD, partial [Parvibaculales bacterium]